MNEKERLVKALHGEETDRVPVICPGGMMNSAIKGVIDSCGIHFPEAHSDAQMMADLAYQVYLEGCFENCGVPFCMTVESEAMGAKVNMGNDFYEPHVCEYAIDTVDDWQKLSDMDLNAGRSKVVLDAIKLLKAKTDSVPIVGNVVGPISTASSIMEPVIFYKQLHKKPEAAHAYMEFVTQNIIKFALAQIEAGADVIAIADPSGTGEILGPKLFEAYTVKYLNMLVDAIHTKCPNVIVHICGRMANVYPQVRQVHAEAISFDSLVDIRNAGENLPGRNLMGNVSTYALEYGTEDKVSAITKKCINDGVCIVSPACGLGMTSPLANIQAMLKTAKGEL